MFNLDNLNLDSRNFSEVKLEPFGEFRIKLITQNKMIDLMGKSEAEFIYECVLNEDNSKAFPSIDYINENVLMNDRDSIFSMILKENHIASKESDIQEK